MPNNTNTLASTRKLIHIAGVALVMTFTLGLAVAVSAHPTANVVTASSSPVKAAQQITVVQPMIAATDKVQPELMHEAPIVEMKAIVATHRTARMVVTAYCPCPKCC